MRKPSASKFITCYEFTVFNGNSNRNCNGNSNRNCNGNSNRNCNGNSNRNCNYNYNYNCKPKPSARSDA